MAEPTILSWNGPNWLTVLLMVAVGFAALSLAAQFFHNGAGTPAMV